MNGRAGVKGAANMSLHRWGTANDAEDLERFITARIVQRVKRLKILFLCFALPVISNFITYANLLCVTCRCKS